MAVYFLSRPEYPNMDTGSLKLRLRCGRAATREEGVGDDFAYLAASGVVVSTEVRQVAATARLTGTSAWIARHNRVDRQPVGVSVERTACYYILELLPGGRFIVPGSISVYLGYLPARGVVVRAEVGQTGGAARLKRPAAGIAADEAPRGHTLDVGIERAAWRQIPAKLADGGIVPTGGIGDHLGDLAPGDGVVGAESRICITAHNIVARQVVNELVVIAAVGHIAKRAAERGMGAEEVGIAYCNVSACGYSEVPLETCPRNSAAGDQR